MKKTSDYWDALAPHHASIENNFLDLRSVRRIVPDIRQPVLVIGAGQGLIVEELQKNGLQTDGVDLSSEMVRFARARRGLNIVQADARAMPFSDGTYQTILYATGVIDFIGDEDLIRLIVKEGRRVAHSSGKMFVAFYRFSAAMEDFLARLGLLRNNVLLLQEVTKAHLLTPIQIIAWVSKRAGVGYLRAAMLAFRLAALSTRQENKAGFEMRKIFGNMEHANSLIESAPEQQPYRNEREIRNLFERLGIKIKRMEVTGSCFIVEI